MVLHNLGAKRAFVVHGSDGLDELTTTGVSTVSELRGGRVHTLYGASWRFWPAQQSP